MLILSIATAMLIVEGLFRLLSPHSKMNAASELGWFRENTDEMKKVMMLDPEFGFRPILGNNIYNDYGALINNYDIKKRKGISRLLFIGDSATGRGKIIQALKSLYGDKKYEYWNAGVESFNTVQEVKFYKRFNYAIKPDHVILTFHNNDFETTPVAFYHNNNLYVYAPKTAKINPRLFKNSYLYRMYVGLKTGISTRGSKIKKDIADETKNSLKELKIILEADGIKFTVLLLPVHKKFEEWSVKEKESRETALAIFKELNVRYFDLLDAQNKAIKDNVRIQEGENDSWHPSDGVSKYFADYLYSNNIL